MHRSSETVAALASALAKAQAELINPEKSLTATIRTGRPGEGSAASAMPRCQAGLTSREQLSSAPPTRWNREVN
jgi:hypothetical protein